MQPILIPGGQDTWALPDGSWASLIVAPNATGDGQVPVRIDTLLGPLALPAPGHAPLGMRPRLDGRRFSGQNWHGGNVLTYDFDSEAWTDGPEKAEVRFGCIYTLDGQLVHDPYRYPGGAQDSSGWSHLELDGTSRGRLVNYDATYPPSSRAPKLNEWRDLSRFGDVFIVGQGNDKGGVHYWDGTVHRWIAHGVCKQVWGWREGDQVAVAFYRELGGYRSEAEVWIGTVAEFKALPEVQPLPVVVPPSPPARPDGPLSPPVPEGTWVNVAEDFFALDPSCWPRGDKSVGNTHGMDYQAVMHFGEPCFWESKYDEYGKGRAGELLSIDMGPDGRPDPKGFVHWRADVSDLGDEGGKNPDGTVRPPREAFVDLPSDTRWLRNVMQIGRQYALDCGDHTLRKVRRRDGSLIVELGFNREMWLVALYRKYWLNPWGECEVLVYAYNNTGFRAGRGNGHPDLYVERYWMARQRRADGSWRVIAWGLWGSDASSIVFAGGGTNFPDPPRTRSAFWHLGGQRFTPDLPPFHMPRSVPAEGPPPPPPVTPPKPEIPGITYPTQPGSGTAEGARKPSQEAADAARRENEGDL